MTLKRCVSSSKLMATPLVAGLMTILFGAGSLPQTQRVAQEETKLLKADSAEMRNALSRFNERIGSEWFCHWNLTTGLAQHIQGGCATIDRAAGDPIRTAEAFLEASRELLGLNRPWDTLLYTKTHGMLSGESLQFQQTYKGIPVWPATVNVRINEDGQVRLLTSNTWPVGDLGITPQLSAAEAQRVIARSHGEKDIKNTIKPTLVIHARGQGVLAWKSFDYVGERREPWRHLVDATTGELLERTCMIQSTKPFAADVASNPPASEETPFAPPPPDEINREWTILGPTTSDVFVAHDHDSYAGNIYLGQDNADGILENPQASFMRGAGIMLLPGIEYSVHVQYALNSWDSYNSIAGNYDLYYAAVNSEKFFWQMTDNMPVAYHLCDRFEHPSNPLGPGQLWTMGGEQRSTTDCFLTAWGPEGIDITNIEPDLEKKVYLSFGLDTSAATGDADTLYPSFGSFYYWITAPTPYFNPNPMVALNDASLVDDNDARKHIPMNAYEQYGPALPNIKDDQPTAPAAWGLQGDYCKIADLGTPPTQPVYSHDKRFAYLRDCDGFEDVNCYLHITEFQLYLQSLGYTGTRAVNARPIMVDPHGEDNDDDSYYYPDGHGTGYVRLGDGGTDDAEDADIIIHEYAHACFDNLEPNILGGYGGYDGDDPGNDPDTNETSAIDEASADFFACHYYSDESEASGFNAAIFAEWDAAHLNPPGNGLRRLDLDFKYPAGLNGGNPDPDGGDPTGHTDSRIFSRVLWDLRGEVGGDRVVKYIIEAVKEIPANATFTDMAVQMLVADIDPPYDGGGNPDTTAIKTAFEDRGILRRLRIRVADEADNPISYAVEVDVSPGDLDNTTEGTGPFDLMYRFNEEVILSAPVYHRGRDLVGWRFNAGGIEPGSADGEIELTLDQNTIPPDGFLATAVYGPDQLLGDLNNDGGIDGADLGLLIALFGSPAEDNPQYDLNEDGLINGGDVGILLANWTG